MAKEVFISYSRKNIEAVKEIKKYIDNAVGIDCWFDINGVESGEQFNKVIIAAIRNHNTVLFMKSAQSMQSEWALDELDFAKHKNKRIVLVHIDDSEMTDDFYFRYHKYDQIIWKDPVHRNKLIRDLKNWFPKDSHINNQSENETKHKAAEDQKIAPYAKREDEKSGAEIHIEVDADCDLFRFKTFIRQLKAGEDNVVYLNPGDYKLDFVSAEFPEIKDSKEYQIEVGKEYGYIKMLLKDKVEEKRKAEEDAKCKAEEEAKRKEEEEHQKKLKALENIWFNPIEKDGKWGFADVSGKVVIPCKWKDAGSFLEGLAAVKDDNEKYGFIDKTGMVVIPCKWKWAGGVSEGLSAVGDDNEKCGYIDKTGKLVIPCQWRRAWPFQEDLAPVMDDNEKWGYIDKTGKLVIPCQWKVAFPFFEGSAIVQDENRKVWTIDKTGKIVEEVKVK